LAVLICKKKCIIFVYSLIGFAMCFYRKSGEPCF